MQIFLELSGHPKANIKRVALAGKTVIGRSQACGLQIASPSVSRKHCEIRFSEETASVVDLGSSNGTFLGSQRLAAGEEHPLSEGIRLNVGGIRFLVSYVHPAKKAAAQNEPSATADETTAAAVGATAAAGSASVLDDEDEPLPLADDDDLLGLSESQEKPVASENSEKVSSEEAPLAAQGDSVILDELQETPEEPAANDLIPAYNDGPAADEDVALIADEPAEAPSLAEPDKANDEVELESETLSGVTGSIETESDILPNVGESELLLDSEEDPDLPSANTLSTSPGADDDSDDKPTAAKTEGASEDVSTNEETTREADELTDGPDDNPIGRLDSESPEETRRETSDEQADEPILDLGDEDQAFAFLDDDDENTPESKSTASDGKLSDFLSQMGRE